MDNHCTISEGSHKDEHLKLDDQDDYLSYHLTEDICSYCELWVMLGREERYYCRGEDAEKEKIRVKRIARQWEKKKKRVVMKLGYKEDDSNDPSEANDSPRKKVSEKIEKKNAVNLREKGRSSKEPTDKERSAFLENNKRVQKVRRMLRKTELLRIPGCSTSDETPIEIGILIN
ncbi:hypothetical protein Tco_0580149 [Tanacetum coccineum]